MLNIDDNKKELIDKLNTNKSSDIYNILEDEIKEAILNRIKMPSIIHILEKELNKKLSINTLKKFIYDNKEKWLKEKRKEEMLKVQKQEKINQSKGEEKHMENNKSKTKKFILLANDKGGVGKTTLGTLLDLPNSIILNLDTTRKISHIYPYKKIADFGIIKQMENIDLEDYLYLINQMDDIEYVIIDTKGGITEDLMKILPYIDSVIIPIKVGSLSEEPSYGFIVELKSYLDELNNKEVKWALVYNDISPKFLKKVSIAKYELLDKFKNTEKVIKKEILGDNLKVITYLKRSEAIITREEERKDIDELMKTNFGAYLPIKNEINRLNKDLVTLT
jgi:cellulose biosynthesis protein BcsQ